MTNWPVKHLNRFFFKIGNSRSKLGFTLIELLVVVLVISVLAGVSLSLISSSGLRSKARDAQRVADLKKIQAALELYFSDNRAYPTITDGSTANSIVINGADDQLTTALFAYMNQIPTDPLFDVATNPPADPCVEPQNYRYNYVALDNSGAEYILLTMMEVATSNDESGGCQALNNWKQYSVCLDDSQIVDVCYGVENP